jgi:uncharacterized protein YoxC
MADADRIRELAEKVDALQATVDESTRKTQALLEETQRYLDRIANRVERWEQPPAEEGS